MCSARQSSAPHLPNRISAKMKKMTPWFLFNLKENFGILADGLEFQYILEVLIGNECSIINFNVFKTSI